MVWVKRILIGCMLLASAGCMDLPSALRTAQGQESDKSLGGLTPGGTGDRNASGGRVLGMDGRPAADVLVRAHIISNNAGGLVSNNAAGYRVAASELETRTDAQGRFQLAFAEGVGYNVEAVKASDVKAIQLGVGGTSAGLQLQLAYTGSIRGRVTSDNPLVRDFEGTDVFIPGTSYVAKADAAGNFTLSSVAVGSFSLTATKAGLGRANLNGVAVASREATQAGNLVMHVTTPSLSSITPLNAGPNTQVTLEGEAFGATTGATFQVSMGGALVSNLQRLDDRTISLSVPSGATTGDVVVTVAGIPSNAAHFTVLKSLAFSQVGRNVTLLTGVSRAYPITALDTAGNVVGAPTIQWRTNSPRATVDADGVVTGQEPGDVSLSVTSGAIASTIPLNVVRAHPQGTIFAGGSTGYVDALGRAARFDGPAALCLAPNGDLFVSDSDNHRIRRVTPEGQVSTYAGGGPTGYGQGGHQDGTLETARFKGPSSLAVDAAGNLYVAEIGNHDVRKITPQGAVSTLAGSGTGGYAEGQGQAAQFHFPSGLAVDAQANVYVADASNNRIRKITPAGLVSTLAGTGEEGFADGPALQAEFDGPSDVVIDPAGNLYVADTNNHRIRKITPQGTVSTVAGTGEAGYANGFAALAQFDKPSTLAFDPWGNLYVTDAYKNLRKITPAGAVFTISGLYGYGKSGGSYMSDGFTGSPVAIAFAADGTMYLNEWMGDWIWRLTSER